MDIYIFRGTGDTFYNAFFFENFSFNWMLFFFFMRENLKIICAITMI
jgi:hypothetical protein